MLYEQVFTTCTTKELALASPYNLDIKQNRLHFKYHLKVMVIDNSSPTGNTTLLILTKAQIKQHDKTIKESFRLWPYIYSVREISFHNAIAQIWSSSDTLNIEHSHHFRPYTPVQVRLCKSCDVVKMRRTLYCLVSWTKTLAFLTSSRTLKLSAPNFEIWMKMNRFIMYSIRKTEEY